MLSDLEEGNNLDWPQWQHWFWY